MVVPVDSTVLLQPAGAAEPEPDFEPGAEFEPGGAARRAGFVALMHNVSLWRAESSPVGSGGRRCVSLSSLLGIK